MVLRSLRQLPVWLRFFVLGRFIKSTGTLAWLYMAVYLVRERGLSPSAAGLVVGVNGAGIIVGGMVGGAIGDRFGIRRTMLLSYLGSAAICVLIPVAPVPTLAAVTGAGGLIGGMAFPLGMALVAGAIPPDQRRAGVALSRAAMNAGVVIGPPLGALVASYDFRVIFLIEAVAGICMAFVVWRFVPVPVVATQNRDNTTSLWRSVAADRTIWMLLVAVLLVDAAYRQIFTGLPLVLTGTGTSLVLYGALVSLSSLLIVVAETPLAIRLASRPALRIITIGYAFIALAFLALAVWPGYGGAVAGIGLITVGEMLYKPTSAAYAADRAPEGMQGRYQSLYSSASISGMVISPPVGGFLYEHAPNLLWPACAGLALLGAAALFAVTPRPAASNEDKAVTRPESPGTEGFEGVAAG